MVEIAIVIIIAGIIMIPIIKLYEVYTAQSKLQITRDNIFAINGQISDYVGPNQRFPCPSDQSLPPSDPNYGREFNNGDCSLSTLTSPPYNLAYPTTPVPSCSASGGFCLVQGAPGRDFDGDSKPDPVLIGGVPIVSINESLGYNYDYTSKIIDGWGGALTYAVTLSMASATTYPEHNGMIRALDEFGQPTAGISDDGEYVIVSHGQDNNGAFSRDGGLMAPCGSILFALDAQNCNRDYIFVSALGQYRGPGVSYFDDVVQFYKSQSNGLWAMRLADAAGNPPSLYNLNLNNVGVNTDNPTARLEVSGTIRGDYNAKTVMVCDKNDANCFKVNDLINSGSIDCSVPGVGVDKCPLGKKCVMTGIQTTMVSGVPRTTGICQPVTPVAKPQTGDCAPSWVNAIQVTTGKLICLDGRIVP